MRQQYHSRWVDGHRWVWDVNRLIARSRDLPVQEVEVASLAELDEPYWGEQPMTAREVASHAKLIEQVDPRHPILLCQEGRLMDGMHRLCRAWMEGRKQLPAVRFPVTPEPDHIDVDPATLPYDT